MNNENEQVSEIESSQLMEERVSSELSIREDHKVAFYSSCFRDMPDRLKQKLAGMKDLIREKMVDYIKGNEEIERLPEEERDLVLRLNLDYRKFLDAQNAMTNLLERNNHTFQVNLNNIEKRIYSSLYNRISFYLLENREKEEDMIKATGILAKLKEGSGNIYG
ncbi:MAG: hypothetical protein MNSN_08020 [Minisyncoccus archaeiphilus]|uniref:hypothetical protein n=1 Tax=Minisyncoccus archaeiphilus TaxID=3238481 RepID=UPI002B1B37EE|nr:MAG: hypothetical protein MNSN_08020 [Candidatus Parcubacteria bacterium]